MEFHFRRSFSVALLYNFLALCKSSWWVKDLTSIEMLPPFCMYFMDVGWIFEKKQSFSLQVLIFSRSLLAHDD